MSYTYIHPLWPNARCVKFFIYTWVLGEGVGCKTFKVEHLTWHCVQIKQMFHLYISRNLKLVDWRFNVCSGYINAYSLFESNYKEFAWWQHTAITCKWFWLVVKTIYSWKWGIGLLIFFFFFFFWFSCHCSTCTASLKGTFRSYARKFNYLSLSINNKVYWYKFSNKEVRSTSLISEEGNGNTRDMICSRRFPLAHK